jgi:hypothetical protein
MDDPEDMGVARQMILLHGSDATRVAQRNHDRFVVSPNFVDSARWLRIKREIERLFDASPLAR